MNLYANFIPTCLPNTPKPLPGQSQTFYFFDIFDPSATRRPTKFICSQFLILRIKSIAGPI